MKLDVSLVGFNGKIVIPKGMIRLPVQMGREVVEVDFIIVDTYSLYTVFLARPWLHAMGVVSLTLLVKVKCPTEGHEAMHGRCGEALSTTNWPFGSKSHRITINNR